jgi:hypothetical protein
MNFAELADGAGVLADGAGVLICADFAAGAPAGGVPVPSAAAAPIIKPVSAVVIMSFFSM